MKTSRRGFFGLVAGAIAAPSVVPLVAQEGRPFIVNGQLDPQMARLHDDELVLLAKRAGRALAESLDRRAAAIFNNAYTPR